MARDEVYFVEVKVAKVLGGYYGPWVLLEKEKLRIGEDATLTGRMRIVSDDKSDELLLEVEFEQEAVKKLPTPWWKRWYAENWTREKVKVKKWVSSYRFFWISTMICSGGST